MHFAEKQIEIKSVWMESEDVDEFFWRGKNFKDFIRAVKSNFFQHLNKMMNYSFSNNIFAKKDNWTFS